jgi:hypothetical protein
MDSVSGFREQWCDGQFPEVVEGHELVVHKFYAVVGDYQFEGLASMIFSMIQEGEDMGESV